ncbi:MAG: hypothetical protein FD147_1004 [Chloroflexi bacterium]|nr:MAG: hypothetical protein FD147_1004 [Chloroflexota bacterium]MBA4374908.1 hypothetical protein [Anaerolinea sp.]
MVSGTPVNRQWVIVLKDGTIAIDWGDGLFQDVRSGDFIAVLEKEVSHHISNEELDWLTKIGRVGSFTRQIVHFHSLPERPQKTIE